VSGGADGMPLPFRSVLVTGAGGFVGGYLLPALRTALGAEASITAVAREKGRTLVDADQTATVDILDADAIGQLIDDVQPDLVIHLAALASVGLSTGAAAATWRTNVGGTVNLAAAIRAHRPECTVLFGSSVEVYGSAFNDGIVDEDTLPAPASPYARSKRAAEWALADVLGPGNRLIVTRPCNHSGPGQTEDFVLPAFAAQVAAIEAGRQSSVLRVGNLEAARDFLDVHDVVDAYLALLASADALPSRSTFNIASGEPQTIAAMLDRLMAMTDTAITVEQDPARMRPSDVPATRIDATRLRELTGWRPRRDLGAMVGSLLDDFRGRT